VKKKVKRKKVKRKKFDLRHAWAAGPADPLLLSQLKGILLQTQVDRDSEYARAEKWEESAMEQRRMAQSFFERVILALGLTPSSPTNLTGGATEAEIFEKVASLMSPRGARYSPKPFEFSRRYAVDNIRSEAFAEVVAWLRTPETRAAIWKTATEGWEKHLDVSDVANAIEKMYVPETEDAE